jgi:predicted PurR-regulated permease PerM
VNDQKNTFAANKAAVVIPLWILAAIALGTLMQEAAVLVLWVTCAFFLFALLDPWMERLNKRGVAPIFSALILVALVTGIFAGIGFVIYQSFPSMMAEFDMYRKSIMGLYHNSTESLSNWIQNISKVPGADVPAAASRATQITKVQVVDNSSPLSGAFANTMLHGLGSAVTVATFAVLTPILTFFLVAERNTFGAVTKRLYPQEGRGLMVWKKITEATGAFFLGNFLLAAVSFPVFLVAFIFFKISSPVTMAALAAVFNLVPFLGALLCGAFPILSMISYGSPVGSIAALAGICVATHFLVANLVTPKVLGSKLDINATTSTIALIAFGELLGGMGLLLAIPIVAVIKILFENSENSYLQWTAALMSEDADSLLKQRYRRVAPTGFAAAGTTTSQANHEQLKRDEKEFEEIPVDELEADNENEVPKRWAN